MGDLIRTVPGGPHHEVSQEASIILVLPDRYAGERLPHKPARSAGGGSAHAVPLQARDISNSCFGRRPAARRP